MTAIIEHLTTDETWILSQYRRAKSNGYARIEIEVHRGIASSLTMVQKFKPDMEPRALREA